MNSQIIDIIYRVEQGIYPLLSIIFCVLALFVLVYYIRRRYKLYKEINIIPHEVLIKESYRNHLKNLKLKCIINNFIIVILVMETLQNLGQIFTNLPSVIINFLKETVKNLSSLQDIRMYSALFYIPMYYTLVPVLSMMMDFLWLAYRKYEYKYRIIKWTWYIVIRILVAFLFQYTVCSMTFFSLNYERIYSNLANAFFGTIPMMDFIQFVYYSRKFYLHLKSREKEIRLFYFDEKAYLDLKYLRIHFKIATILVGIAIFFLMLSNTENIFAISIDIPHYITLPQQLNYILSMTYQIYADSISNVSFIILQLLFIFNYFYIFIVVVYKSYRNRQKWKNINNYIRPIIEQYHETCFNRYTNYA